MRKSPVASSESTGPDSTAETQGTPGRSRRPWRLTGGGLANRPLNRFLLSLLHWSLLILLTAACASQPLTVTPRPVTLQVVTSDACTPLMERLASAYRENRPWVTFRMEVFNRAVAEERVRSGAADLAAFVGPGAGDLWSVPFATDGVAVIVHPDVPVEGLTLAELREVFRGRVGEWPDGTPIQVVSREEGSGTRAVFEAVVLGEDEVTLTAVVVPDSQWMLETVATTAGAIGYISQARLDGRMRALAVEGVYPLTPTLPDYPLRYSLLLATPSEPVGEARRFIQWVLGPQGQQWVSREFAPP